MDVLVFITWNKQETEQLIIKVYNQQNPNFYTNWFYLIGNRMIIWI